MKQSQEGRVKQAPRRRRPCVGGRLALSALACLLAQSGVADPLELVRDGRPCADIVIANNPPRAAKLAAMELREYLFKITGAKLAITTVPGTDRSAHVYVGRSAYTDQLKVVEEGLRYGAFRIVVGRDHLVLLGRDKDFTLPRYAPRSREDAPRALAEWDAHTGETWENPSGRAWATYSPAVGLWEHDERGSLNAVYEFLRGLGVR